MPLFGTEVEQMKIKCPNCGKIQNIPDIYVNRKTVKCVECKAEIPLTPSKSSFPKKPVLTGFAVFFGLLVLIIILAIAIPSNEPEHSATKQKKYNRKAVKPIPQGPKEPASQQGYKENHSRHPESTSRPHAVKQQLPEQKYKPQKKSLAYMLATIDKGYVSEGDTSITRFRSLLNQLDRTYVEDQQTIADMTVMARKILRDKYGIDESLRNIMEGMNQIFYQHNGFQYAEYVTAYVQLRNAGKSHSEAVRGLSSLVQALMGK